MRKHQNHRRGFTLIEATVSIVIVGVMFASALSMAGASKMTRHRRALSDRAHVLADALLAEVMALPYEDPDEATSALGQDASDVSVYNAKVAGDPEGHTVRRDWCDDIDDLNGWNQQPPVNYDGSAIAEAAGWQRKISVDWVKTDNLNAKSNVETGIKCIKVTVCYQDTFEITMVALRSRAR